MRGTEDAGVGALGGANVEQMHELGEGEVVLALRLWPHLIQHLNAGWRFQGEKM